VVGLEEHRYLPLLDTQCSLNLTDEVLVVLVVLVDALDHLPASR
jgi:hypothetical protein